jgi:hypothetical protein
MLLNCVSFISLERIMEPHWEAEVLWNLNQLLTRVDASDLVLHSSAQNPWNPIGKVRCFGT